MDWFDLAVQGTLKSLLQHHSLKASILWHSAFFMVQLSHNYWKNHSFDYMNFCRQDDVSAFLIHSLGLSQQREKAGLKLNIQKTKSMASGPITSWQIDGEKVEVVTDFLFSGSKITVRGDCSHEIKRRQQGLGIVFPFNTEERKGTWGTESERKQAAAQVTFHNLTHANLLEAVSWLYVDRWMEDWMYRQTCDEANTVIYWYRIRVEELWMFAERGFQHCCMFKHSLNKTW